MKLGEYGFVRTAAAVPRVFVANPMKNAEEIAALVLKAAEEGARIVAFPELSVTGYTCADLSGRVRFSRCRAGVRAHRRGHGGDALCRGDARCG